MRELKKLPNTNYDLLNVASDLIDITRNIAEEIYNEYPAPNDNTPPDQMLRAVEEKTRKIMYLSQYSSESTKIKTEVIRILETMIYQHLSSTIGEDTNG